MTNIKKILIGTAFSVVMFGALVVPVFADSVSVNFENPPYSLGTINSQDGWSSLGAAGSGCAVYDHAVNSSLGTSGFGSQSLRVSNAVTSGCFGDMTFAKPLVDSVGETSATAGTFSTGTKQTHFEMQFDIASTVPGSQQPGLFMSVSPDRGDGSRMSYVGFEDVAGGIDMIFYDVQGTGNPANFVLTDLGTYTRTPHTVKLVMDVVDGPSNDVVKVYIDGVLKHTGTSWENYYRFDSEASAEQSVRIVKTTIFRTGGAAAPATAGFGYLVDNFSSSSGPTPIDPFAVPAECSAITGLGAPIVGTASSDNINGTSGNDLIFALGGSDRVNGKGGNDCIVGGDGSDRLVGGNGDDVILGGAGSDSIDGNNHNDSLYGEGGSDSIKGGNGNDMLSGGDQSDSLRGDGGTDTIDGGDGSDSANGGGGSDTCTAEAESSCEI